MIQIKPLEFIQHIHAVRSLDEGYLTRLTEKIKALGVKPAYPLSVTPDGVLFGGCHRFEVFKRLGHTEAWMHIHQPDSLDREAIELNIAESTNYKSFTKNQLPIDEVREGTVYFLLGRKTNLLKIGFATDVEDRISTIRAMSPDVLDLVKTIPGTFQIEKELHKNFAEYRVHGEWFKCTGFLSQFVGNGENK